MMEFNNFRWHDAVIKNIQIDRNNPGKEDSILFEIIWPDNQENKIIFEDVYWAELILGFGIVAEESIYEAFIAPKDDSDVITFFNKWKGKIKKEELDCYVFKTASTGSKIKIIAKKFRIIQR